MSLTHRCLADVHMRSGGHNSGVAAEELLRKSVLLYTAAFSGGYWVAVTMVIRDDNLGSCYGN